MLRGGNVKPGKGHRQMGWCGEPTCPAPGLGHARAPVPWLLFLFCSRGCKLSYCQFQPWHPTSSSPSPRSLQPRASSAAEPGTTALPCDGETASGWWGCWSRSGTPWWTCTWGGSTGGNRSRFPRTSEGASQQTVPGWDSAEEGEKRGGVSFADQLSPRAQDRHQLRFPAAPNRTDALTPCQLVWEREAGE